ncbi:MAG TPA: hypothetical protein VIS27_09610 [Yeosuana sp.]
MKTYKLYLPGCRGFSVNKAYYKSTFTRTTECRQWARGIAEALQSPTNMSEITKFLNTFNRDVDAIGIFLKFKIPRGTFYTQKNDISRHSMDLTNVEKLLVDIVFDRKHGPHALDLDDKMLVQCISEKVPSDTFSIIIGLKVLKRL